MREYEIAVLYHPDLEVDLTKAEERVTAIIKNNQGSITSTDNWGKRKLAYPIKKLEHAVYVFYKADIPPTSVQKIESTLNITDEVIRFLVVKIDPKQEAQEEAEKLKKEKKAAHKAAKKEAEESAEPAA